MEPFSLATVISKALDGAALAVAALLAFVGRTIVKRVDGHDDRINALEVNMISRVESDARRAEILSEMRRRDNEARERNARVETDVAKIFAAITDIRNVSAKQETQLAVAIAHLSHVGDKIER